MTEHLHIDEDWKRRAQAEKEQLAQQFSAPKGAASRNRPLETASGASISALVRSLAHQAAAFLGLAPDPVTGEARTDLQQARFMIDLLEVLAEKTKGNLAPEEERELDSTRHDLRLAYAEVAQLRRRGPPPQQDPFA